MSQPYVGILVNHRLYEGICDHRTRYEHVEFYEQAGALYGLQVCYFRLEDVNCEQGIVHCIVKIQSHYQRMHLPIPSVIHNRAIHLHAASYCILEKWRSKGILLFNFWNRYNKWYIHQLLQKNPDLHVYLPATYPATVKTIREMQLTYPSLLIKPNKSSIGRGIMKFERIRKQRATKNTKSTSTKTQMWRLTYPKQVKSTNRTWKVVDVYRRLPAVLQRRIACQPYVVQQRISLATLEGRPFDIRVSVQRGATGEWGITGMVGKLAAKRHFLTNIGQGGKAYPLMELLRSHGKFNLSHTLEAIEQCAMKIVHQLSKELPSVADVGLDIGLCEQGAPMFIECNGKDQRYTFREAGLMQEWQATYTNPMAYAHYLLETQQVKMPHDLLISRATIQPDNAVPSVPAPGNTVSPHVHN